MHLLELHDDGRLSIARHDVDNLPAYAVLSHTWATDDEELTFQTVLSEAAKSKTGYHKVRFCGEQARKDGLRYFWVDSCCIDKTNSVELSEALLTMFRLYQGARKCYVCLQDVTKRKRDHNGNDSGGWETAMRQSRWFTRGWTLQELLAPKVVEFFSRDGDLLGDKKTLEPLICAVTGIPARALRGAPLSHFEPKERMSWATRRDTKRKEDKAYCLMGIFDVFITPMYGEGEYAFMRLQDEIEKRWNRLVPAANSAWPAGPPCGSATRTTGPGEVPESELNERRQAMVDSLAFEQMDSRRANIKDAQQKTCEWLLDHPTYIAWSTANGTRKQQEILWINGKPGAGKSTIVKFAHARAKRAKSPDEILVCFFFNARGDQLEKTTTGMYRALLSQILTNDPNLQEILDNVENDTLVEWSLTRLEELFRAIIARLGKRRLKCFIDALDECDERQIRDMVRFFDELAEQSDEEDCQLYICFASRHYPTINIHGGWKMILEDEVGHSQDLEKYIKKRLQAGTGKAADQVRANLLEKANSVFMWAVLVVEILNEEYLRGRIFAVKSRLAEIPAELSELFRNILQRDNVHMDELLLSLQWILFAKRPLSVEEYYFAMVAGCQQEDNDYFQHQVAPDSMVRFLTSSSKGLAEIVKSKNLTVQFIHESVRDFLVKDRGLTSFWPHLGSELTSASHDRLKICCYSYLCMSYRYPWFQTAKTKWSKDDGKLLRQEASEQFPLLEYACQHVFHHANEAAQDIPQRGFLAGFSSKDWTVAANLLEKHAIRRYSCNVPLVYIFAEQNFARLIGELRPLDLWQHLAAERHQYVLVAAFTNGNREALQALAQHEQVVFIEDIAKDPGFGKTSQWLKAFSKGPSIWAAKNGHWAFAEYLLSQTTPGSTAKSLHLSKLDAGFVPEYHNGEQPWLAAFAHCNLAVMKRILQIPALDKQPFCDAAVYYTIKCGNEALLRLVLAEDQIGNRTHTDALKAACRGGITSCVQLLIAIAQYDQVELDGGLREAIRGTHHETVRWLVSKIQYSQETFTDVLSEACRRGDLTIIEFLLSNFDYEQNALGAAFLDCLCFAQVDVMEAIILNSPFDLSTLSIPVPEDFQHTEPEPGSVLLSQLAHCPEGLKYVIQKEVVHEEPDYKHELFRGEFLLYACRWNCEPVIQKLLNYNLNYTHALWLCTKMRPGEARHIMILSGLGPKAVSSDTLQSQVAFLRSKVGGTSLEVDLTDLEDRTMVSRNDACAGWMSRI